MDNTNKQYIDHMKKKQEELSYHEGLIHIEELLERQKNRIIQILKKHGIDKEVINEIREEI